MVEIAQGEILSKGIRDKSHEMVKYMRNIISDNNKHYEEFKKRLYYTIIQSLGIQFFG